MLERVTDGFVSLDAEWRILYANPQAERMVAVRREDYAGRNFWAVFPELKGTVFQEQYERAAVQKVPVHFETLFAPLDRWFEVSVYPAQSGLSILFRDVTEKRRLADELRKLSLIATNSQNMVVVTDAERRITWVNEAFTRRTGYSLAEAVGQNPGRLLQGPESDREAVHYMRKQIARGEAFQTEVVNYTKSGEKYWADVYGQAVMDADGRVQQYFAVSNDITARRQLQEQLLQEQKRRQRFVTAATIKAQEGERARVGREL
ncbi:MAG TPA: PAS domain-containing protein, partial [Candidatus Sulfotelmatobacter sp.]|nr:PAS domain-containing protein [Candidatus Sulfotelmatobacter sp.]